MTVEPAVAQGFSVAFDSVEFLVSAGDVKTGSIGVLNSSSEPISLRIYTGDWVRIPGDVSGYEFDEERGNEPRSFLEWLTFSPERMSLQPDERRDVQYEIRVPQDHELEGSYWGVIFIEEVPTGEASDDTAEPEELRVGITTVFRYAVQIYVTVEGTEVREVTFNSIDFAQDGNTITATAVVENLGNVYMRPQVWIELRDTMGDVVYSREHIRQTLLPESAREYAFELTDLDVDPGTYLAMIIADYGAPSLIAAQGRIELTETATGEEPSDD
jgi:hypothetical protein